MDSVACQVASRRDSDQQGGTGIDQTATDLESGMRLAASHNFREENFLLGWEFRVRECVGGKYPS